MDYLLFIPLAASFLISYFFVGFWIKKARQIGLVWDDMNKYQKVKVAGSGGAMVVVAFIISTLIFVQYNVFVTQNTQNLISILASLLTVLFLAGIGLVDDLLGWQKGGLGIFQRVILIFLGSMPLVAINAGRSILEVPFLGEINFGLVYPFILIPLGILGASTMYNILAGFNGLEAGQGVILISAFSIIAYLTGSAWLSFMGLCLIFAILGFMIYNINPAKIFPGDSLTYSIGAFLAIMSILGNFERIAVFLFTPYIIESCLKIRGKLRKQSFGKPNSDGSLDLKYDKIYSLNHLSIILLKKIGIKSSETNAVLLIHIFQVIIILIGFLVFKGSLF